MTPRRVNGVVGSKTTQQEGVWLYIYAQTITAGFMVIRRQRA